MIPWIIEYSEVRYAFYLFEAVLFIVFNQDDVCFHIAARQKELFAVRRKRESAENAGFEIGDLSGRAAAEDWRLPEIHPLFIQVKKRLAVDCPAH